VVTSPPYWGLRDYKIDGQIGLEKTPEEFIEKMTDLFQEVKRVLKPDGVLWLNMGDSYAGSGMGRNADGTHSKGGKQETHRGSFDGELHKAKTPPGLKPKDLCGMPWRLALALQASGWYLRADVIWHKPNPMPESTQDRPTKSHEYIFLLTKSEKYFYDNEAIKEPLAESTLNDARLTRENYEAGRPERGFPGSPSKGGGLLKPKRSGNKERKPRPGAPEGNNKAQAGSVPWEGATRNKRSVWTIATRPFKEAHFATFPEEIPLICIKAGSRKGDLIFDPFNGAGTTGLVALKLERNYIGIELNPEYIAISKKRIEESLGTLFEL
jgi:DNA modification methylase